MSIIIIIITYIGYHMLGYRYKFYVAFENPGVPLLVVRMVRTPQIAPEFIAAFKFFTNCQYCYNY